MEIPLKPAQLFILLKCRQNHRKFRWQSTSTGHLIIIFPQNTAKLDHIDLDPTQLSFENLRGEQFYNLSMQLLPVLNNYHWSFFSLCPAAISPFATCAFSEIVIIFKLVFVKVPYLSNSTMPYIHCSQHYPTSRSCSFMWYHMKTGQTPKSSPCEFHLTHILINCLKGKKTKHFILKVPN